MAVVAKETRAGRWGSYHQLLARCTGETLWVCSGTATGTIGTLLMVRVFTAHFQPEQYGMIALGLATAATLQWPFVCLAQALLRYTSAAVETQQVKPFKAAALKLSLQSVVAATCVFLVITIFLLVTRRSDWLPFASAAFLLSLFTGGSCLVEHVQVALRHRATVAIHQAVLPFARMASVLGIVGLWNAKATVALFAMALATLLIFASQLVCLLRSLPSGTDDIDGEHERVRDWSGRLFSYCSPLIAWVGFSSLQLYSDRWSLQLFSTAEDLGLYASLYQIGYSPMVLASGMLSQLMIPIVFGTSGIGTDAGRVKKALRLTTMLIGGSLLFVLICTLIAAILHQQVFHLMVAEEYRGISFYLPVLVLSGGLFAVGQVATYPLLISNNTRLLVRPKIVTAIIGILSMFAAAAFGGITWVIYQGPAFGVVYLVWMYYVSKRHAR